MIRYKQRYQVETIEIDVQAYFVFNFALRQGQELHFVAFCIESWCMKKMWAPFEPITLTLLCLLAQ